MPEINQEIMKGTTTVGLVFDEGIVLATEKRATMGTLIASKTAKKVYQIADRIGMTTAGGVGDAQSLARLMQVECSLYKVRHGKPISVGAAATLLSNYLQQNRYYPYYVQLLVGGVDRNGPSVYSVDAMGGASKETDIVSTGSGSPMAYGVLEDRYHADMNEPEAVDLATRSLKAAMRRDSASGENISIVVITRDKYEEKAVQVTQMKPELTS
ncbi:proteasome endopeptidase complex, beta subunit [Methanofollis liminatans DSM 4140]|jgi:proteasome beta subunit|uniref:Proteasome subunit beta n=1 Tax=Methanofollis liminatans DSM 4140 TaxID=28892 RepID=J1L1R9_9EURY|nr:archaeal proteasome endopeptidase complex subunit beta [Methanofollis liminatans]EJG06972.1 proteasome endopeptidase complex, beta subunit [Methanofollis liminatans DSM 4140]